MKMSNLTPTTYEIIKELTAKVQELEERIDSLCKSVNYWKNERQSTYVADGIEEYANYLEIVGNRLEVEQARIYASKLREGE